MNPVGTIWANVEGVGNKPYCNLNAPRNGNYGDGFGSIPVPIIACQTLFSTFLTAKVTRAPVVLHFTWPVTCNSNGNAGDWFNLDPYYIVLAE